MISLKVVDLPRWLTRILHDREVDRKVSADHPISPSPLISVRQISNPRAVAGGAFFPARNATLPCRIAFWSKTMTTDELRDEINGIFNPDLEP
ncbi:MAG TPA: hypothetical protein VHM90_06810, partial [Phycisphaerae bacterium]|nr:hypothetical protein [Phycisphaerae bacterium]